MAGTRRRARVQLGQGLLHQIQPPQHRAGQPGMVGIEVAGQGLCQLRILRRILPLAMSASPSGSCSPSIIAVSIARAETSSDSTPPTTT